MHPASVNLRQGEIEDEIFHLTFRVLSFNCGEPDFRSASKHGANMAIRVSSSKQRAPSKRAADAQYVAIPGFGHGRIHVFISAETVTRFSQRYLMPTVPEEI